jgi:5'-3' exonuclease
MRTLILDGNNAAHRLFHKLPVLTAGNTPIQVVYGMLKLLRSSITQFEPDAVLVCWDNGRSAYRKKLYPAYKAQRQHDKDDKYKSILSQIKILQDTLRLLNIACVDFPHTEADDLIGIATQCLKGEKIIITSDQDALHLVTKGISVWSPIKMQLYDENNFRKILDLSPQQWLELRALTGDSSDNIEGVANGFGIITAKELLLKYGSLENLFSSSVEKRVIQKGKRYALLYSEGAKERAYRNLMLMDLRICCSRPEGQELAKLISKHVAERNRMNKLEVLRYFRKQKFQTFIEQFSIWITPFAELDTRRKVIRRFPRPFRFPRFIPANTRNKNGTLLCICGMPGKEFIHIKKRTYRGVCELFGECHELIRRHCAI